MQYINLGILLITLGFVIGVYVHTDKKIAELSERTDRKIDKLSDEIKDLTNEIKENNRTLNDRIDKLSDRMDRLYDILVHMGFRDAGQKDKAVNE